MRHVRPAVKPSDDVERVPGQLVSPLRVVVEPVDAPRELTRRVIHRVTNAGDTIELKTPSGQTSGLKVQVHQDMTGGILYRLVLDFDAGKSIVKAGNSGNFILKPVIRILSLVPSGGNIQGYVLPDSVRTLVLAIQGTDTIASSFSDPSAYGYWLIKDVPAGNYSLSFLPSDTTFQPEYRNATVALGQVTVVDTVKLHQ